jgi:hypothetical protein
MRVTIYIIHMDIRILGNQFVILYFFPLGKRRENKKAWVHLSHVLPRKIPRFHAFQGSMLICQHKIDNKNSTLKMLRTKVSKSWNWLRLTNCHSDFSPIHMLCKPPSVTQERSYPYIPPQVNAKSNWGISTYGMLFNPKKDRYSHTWYCMDKPWGLFTIWNKLITKGQILHGFPYVRYLKQLNYENKKIESFQGMGGGGNGEVFNC